MSSTIALEPKAQTRGALLDRQRSLARRTGALADRIALHIESLVPQGAAECLDIGNGDLTLAESIEELLPRTRWHCIDVHPTRSRARDDERWRPWSRLDGRKFPFDDGQFDVALLCDILHAVPEDAPLLLTETARVAQHVLVKDRFRTGIGEPYFSQEAFGRLVAEQGLVITALDCGLDRHGDASVLRREWQFVAVLQRS